MKRITELRKKAGLQQKQLAEKLNLYPTTLYKYEKGVVEPSLDMLMRLADFFGVSIDYLVEHECAMLDRRMLTDDQNRLLDLILAFNPLEQKEALGYLNHIKELKDKK